MPVAFTEVFDYGFFFVFFVIDSFCLSFGFLMCSESGRLGNIIRKKADFLRMDWDSVRTFW